MLFKPAFLGAFLFQASAVRAIAETYYPAQAKNQGIQWSSCTLNSTMPIECANFSVPLDYSSPNSTELLTLELLRAPATKTPSKRSVLINFGGPGLVGRESLASGAKLMLDITGSYHDLIAFDPR